MYYTLHFNSSGICKYDDIKIFILVFDQNVNLLPFQKISKIQRIEFFGCKLERRR